MSKQSNICPKIMCPKDGISTDDSLTAVDYLQTQLELEREARELMPFDPNVCTYTKGELRQPVFACLTCSRSNNNTPIGICYSCSIQCHSTHGLVELFSKRNFVCDCGTTRMANTSNGACQLRRKDLDESKRTIKKRTGSIGAIQASHIAIGLSADDISSSSNIYNQNYQGLFCACSKLYNPLEETANMIQCYFGFTCGEDWYHEDCILGYKPGVLNQKKGESENILDKLPPAGVEAKTDNSYRENSTPEPVKVPYFPSLEDFDSFICWKCVNDFKHIFKQIEDDKDIVLTKLPHFNNVESAEEWERRYNNFISKNNEEDGEPRNKKARLEDREIKNQIPYSIFLNPTFREKLNKLRDTLSKDSKLYSFLANHEYLYKADPIFEPPKESDDGVSSTGSLLDLGTDALSTLPREQALEGLQAYDKIRSKLREFFKPFAEQGKVVTEDEVRDFFNKIRDDEEHN